MIRIWVAGEQGGLSDERLRLGRWWLAWEPLLAYFIRPCCFGMVEADEAPNRFLIAFAVLELLPTQPSAPLLLDHSGSSPGFPTGGSMFRVRTVTPPHRAHLATETVSTTLPRVALLEVAYGLRSLAQRIGPVDDGPELARAVRSGRSCQRPARPQPARS